MQRIINEYNSKKINEITSYDIISNLLSILILKKNNLKIIEFIEATIPYHIDNLGMHKSYNILEHAKYINNLNELKTICLYFKINLPINLNEIINKMTSTLNEYFHLDGSLPLFNGSNNNYTNLINNTLNKETYLKSRKFINIKNGIAIYTDKNKKLFFDVVQPNKDKISQSLNAGTLSFEMSCMGEKIITNCGASESSGKNPEYLRYSAAHSTIILQNTNISEIKENNPHLKFPQSVTFDSNRYDNLSVLEGSHNGYIKKFNKIIKRKIDIEHNSCKIIGEDSIISFKKNPNKVIYHIRFHLMNGMVLNFTNNKKNIIIKTKKNSIWMFKSDVELKIEDSIVSDINTTLPTKQIVIKGFAGDEKQVRRWELEKI